jgi:AbrB family looped-hinge helix DNA binding protein
MKTRVTIDKAGRVVIPKPLREELQLEPGDSLEMESAGEQITLRPVRGTRPLMIFL